MKYRLLLILFLISNKIMACPGCVGSMENSKQSNLVPILCIFVVLTYVPFYLIYKTIIKHRDLNKELAAELKSLEDAAQS